MRPPSLASLLAAILGCAVLLVVSCSPTEAPGEAALAFDVQGVIRDVTAQAGPTLFPEVPVDSPVYSFSGFAPQGHQVAHGGGIYLVVWSIPSFTRDSYVYQIMATRVRAQDGAVLDPGGLVLASNVLEEPGLAVASDGTNFLVAWDSYNELRRNNSSIFARRVSGATGASLDPEPFRVSPVGNASITPALAFDGSHFLVVWSQLMPENSDDIHGARVRASDGAVLEPDGLVLCAAPGRQSHPAVAFGAGQFLVVWQDQRAGASSIQGTRVRAADGMVLEPSGMPIKSGGSGNALLPVVAAIDGTFLVVWRFQSTHYTALGGTRVQASEGLPSGLEFSLPGFAGPGSQQYALVPAGTHFQWVWSNVWSDSRRELSGAKIPVTSGEIFDFKLLVASGTGDETRPVLAMGENQFMTVWFDTWSNQLLALRMHSASMDALDPAPLLCATDANAQLDPAVAKGSSDTLVVWADSRNRRSSENSLDIYGLRVRNSDGVVLDSSPILIARSDRSKSAPSVAFDGQNYLVVWTETQASGARSIRGARVRASDGVVLDPTGIVIATTSSPQSRAALAFGGGTYLVTWVDLQNDLLRAMRIRAADGALLDPSAITVSSLNTARWQHSCSVAYAQNSFLVVWEDIVNDSSNIYGARVRRLDGKVLDTVAIPLNTMSGSQFNPRVVASSSQFLVAWQDTRFGTYDLYGTRVRGSDGMSLDGTGLALNTEPENKGHPSLAFDGTSYVMTWSSNRQATVSKKLTRVTTQGTVLDVPGLVIADSSTDSMWSDTSEVAALGPRHFLVAYDHFDAGVRQWRVRFRRWADFLANGSQCTSGPECESGVCTALRVCCDRVCTWGSCGTGTCVEPDLRLTCPEDPVAEAISASGTNVFYSYQVRGPGPFSVLYSQPPGARFPLGTTPVTLKATDRLGNSQSCAFQVHVRDTTAPTLSCPAHVSVESTNVEGVTVNYPPASAADSVSLVTLGYSQGSGTRFALGTTPVTVTAADAAGNTSTCGFNVTVKLPPEPRVACPATVVAEATSAAGASVAYPPATVQGSAPLTLAYSHESGTRFMLGTTLVIATVTDGLGRTEICAFQVRVRDTTAPTLSCPTPVTVDATSPSGTPVNYPPATASDSVSPVTLGYSQGSGTHFAVGTTPVTVTAADAAGNVRTCGFDVTVRPPAPRVTCPGDLAVEATSASGATVSYPPATAEGTASLTLAYSHASGTRFPLGTTPITTTVTDGLGRTASCVFQVHVRDTTAPALACPAPVTLKATSLSGTPVNYPPATASDSVSPVTLGYSQGSGTRFAVGTTAVTVTATDASGNASTCGFDVTVRLPAPPQVTCPGDVRAEATSPSGSTVYYAPASAQGTAPLALSYSRASGTRIALGTTPLTATVTDGLGRTATCVFQVHVRDTTEPSLSCPAPVTAEATSPSGASVTYPPATASDTVSPVTIDYSHASGAHFAVGTTPVTVTATDASGNSTTCDFEVTVTTGASGPL